MKDKALPYLILNRFTEHSMNKLLWSKLWPNYRATEVLFEVIPYGYEILEYVKPALQSHISCSHVNFRFRACFEEGVP